jgi:hypothetical protein
MKNLRTILAEEGLSRTASPVRHGDERKLERNLDKLVGDFLVYAELDEAYEATQDFIQSLQDIDDRAREAEEKRVIYGPRLAKEAERNEGLTKCGSRSVAGNKPIKQLIKAFKRVGILEDPEDDFTGRVAWSTWSHAGTHRPTITMYRADPKVGEAGWQKMEKAGMQVVEAFARANPDWELGKSLEEWVLTGPKDLGSEAAEKKEMEAKIKTIRKPPANFNAFTRMLAKALKGNRVLPEHITDALGREGYNESLFDAWQSIEDDERDMMRMVKSDPRSFVDTLNEPFLQRQAENIADGIMEVMSWHNNAWNFGPGDAPEKVKINSGWTGKIYNLLHKSR